MVLALLLTLLSWLASGPAPAKPDVLYLLHADNLVETEQQTAAEQHKGSGKKEETTYTLAGAASPVKTPLASPVFLMDARSVDPERLELYRVEVRGDHREITMGQKKRVRSIGLSVKRQEGGVVRLEAVESLPNGEYVVTPAGSNQVFAFSVY